MNAPNFSGPAYVAKRDHVRLSKQHERIASLMSDGVWRTVREIANATGDPENSVQAQLRHLRKPRFGGFIVSKSAKDVANYGANTGGERVGAWHYRVRPRCLADPPYVGGKSIKNVKAKLEAVEGLLDKALEEMDKSLDLTTRAMAFQIRELVE